MIELTNQKCELCNKEEVCYKLIKDNSVKFFGKGCLDKPENSHLKEKFREQINCEWKEV